jgi:DNA-binding XRE family transcriptional regulator
MAQKDLAEAVGVTRQTIMFIDMPIIFQAWNSHFKLPNFFKNPLNEFFQF